MTTPFKVTLFPLTLKQLDPLQVFCSFSTHAPNPAHDAINFFTNTQHVKKKKKPAAVIMIDFREKEKRMMLQRRYCNGFSLLSSLAFCPVHFISVVGIIFHTAG
jgi:hypothetical protein